MTIFSVALKYLRGRLVASSLTTFSVAIGVILVISTPLLTRGVKDGFIEGTTDYNLIVGAKGSPTQLVLNAIFRMDTPTPNIPYTAYEDLKNDSRVDVAVPAVMGDAYQGFRHVSTTGEYFKAFSWRRRKFTLSEGRFFRDDPPDQPTYEALLGSEVAKRTELKRGDKFYEGEEMVEYPLTVVGILQPTHGPDDRTIFFSLASFWEMQEIARGMTVKPLTAVLIRPKRMSDLPSLHREFNVAPETQAVFPSSVLLNIFNLLSTAEEVLRIVLGIVVVVVLLSLFVSMYSATLERKREIATMRALGARRATILAIILLESLIIAAIGGIIGVAGGHGVAYLGAQIIERQGGLAMNPFLFSSLQPVVLGSVILLGTLAGLIPALMAYRTEVAENLAPLS
ncbi:MAG: ABC transporter permease [Candidatus Tectomicrobia bacterium]|nr:ABC transporter permease [Candidatus Tectomicrobia bacterium]